MHEPVGAFIVQVPFRAALLENLKSLVRLCNNSEAAAPGAMEWAAARRTSRRRGEIAALGANLTAVVTQGADATVICKGETPRRTR